MRQYSTATLLVRGGTLVTPEGFWEADVLAQGGRIKAVGRGLPTYHDTRVVDAEECHVLPGVIDAHTHIQLDTGVYQTADDWFVGTRAAACGGVTTVVDFATQFPGQTLREAVDARLKEAEGAVIDYGFHVMITDLPAGEEDEIADLVDLGAPSAKLYTTYRPNYYADDATILRLMEACADHGVLPLVHCENDALVTGQTEALKASGQTSWRHHGRSRPALAEQEAIQRVLFLAEAAGSPVHICHCSTARSVSLVAEAAEAGQLATCETCPQYLLLDNQVYDGAEPWRYILQPPLRDPGETDLLWTLLDARYIGLLCTDHCDYTRAQKLAEKDFTQTPGGLPGMETLLPLMVTYGVADGRLSFPQVVELLCANPARLWGLWPQKGTLRPGSDADLVVYDPAPEGEIREEALHYAAGYTPYDGMAVQGEVRATISRGEIIYHQGHFTGREGRGRFVRREPLA
ncbi:MAG: dihydropyrimidinase [Anaerolineae bacterium]